MAQANLEIPIPNLGMPFDGTYQITRDYGEKFEIIKEVQGVSTASAQQDQAFDGVTSQSAALESAKDRENLIGTLLSQIEGEAGHNGVDFAMSEGTPVLAVEGGVIEKAGEGDYGITVVIKHDWGRSIYGHLSKSLVEVGGSVSKGQQIALSGSTGLATGPHLHLGIKNNKGEFLDPLPYLERTSGTLSDQGSALAEATSSASLPAFEDTSQNPAFLYSYKFDLANGVTAHFALKNDPRPAFSIADKNYSHALRFFFEGQNLESQTSTSEGINRASVADGNQVDFPVQIAGVEAVLRYTVTKDRVKEEIILSEKPAQISAEGLKLNFEVQKVGLEQQQSGSEYIFNNQDSSVSWILEEPFATDAADKREDLAGEIRDSKYALDLEKEFLENARYPLVIDPSVAIYQHEPMTAAISKIARFRWKLAVEYEIRDIRSNLLGSDVVIVDVLPGEEKKDLLGFLEGYLRMRLAIWQLAKGRYQLREMAFDRVASAHFQKEDSADDVFDEYYEERQARKKLLESLTANDYLSISLTYFDADLLQRPEYDEVDENGTVTGRKLRSVPVFELENERIGAGTEILRPNGDVAGNDYSVSGATNHYEAIDESTADDDTTYIYSPDGFLKIDTWELTNTALTTETITSVDTLHRSKHTAVSATVTPKLRISGSSASQGGVDFITTSYANYSDTGYSRPGGGSWAVSDLNGLQGEVQGGSGAHRITQFYVTVNYSTNQNPDAPTSLGPTAYVNGSWGTDDTPTLTFTLSDPDTNDQVKFQIQIDDFSAFSSPAVDYTSALQSEGSASFTVGQAAGSGSYTAGSAGQTLSDESNYYWRVKAIDDDAAESSWSTANSGSIAFKVDDTPPSTVSNLSSSSHSTSTWSSDATIDVSWTAATDATSNVAGYSYTFDTTSDTTPDSTSDGTGTSTTSSAQSDGNSIYFHVRAIDNAGNAGSASHLGPFYVDATAPTAPGTPSTTSPTKDTTPTWTFDASTDATSGLDADTPYSVQWCTDSGFSGCSSNTGTATSASFTHSTALADGTWYFRARATDEASNNSDYSSSGTVVIDTTPPSRPANLTSRLLSDKKTRLTWEAANAASSYSIYQSLFNSPGQFSSVATTSDVTYDITMSSCDPHWFYVTALDSISNESGGSNLTKVIPRCPSDGTSTSSSSSSSSSSSDSSSSSSSDKTFDETTTSPQKIAFFPTSPSPTPEPSLAREEKEAGQKTEKTEKEEQINPLTGIPFSFLNIVPKLPEINIGLALSIVEQAARSVSQTWSSLFETFAYKVDKTLAVWFRQPEQKNTITDVAIEFISPETAVVSWKTKKYSTSKVNYGFDTAYGLEEISNDYVRNHRLTLENLEPGKTYYFEVMSMSEDDYVYDAYYTFTVPE